MCLLRGEMKKHSGVYPLTTVCRLPSAVYRLPATVHRLLATVCRLPATVYRLSSSVRGLLSVLAVAFFLSVSAGDANCFAAQSGVRTDASQGAGVRESRRKKAAGAALQKYAGRYELETGIIPISTLDVTLENEELWLKPSALKKRRLIHRSKSVFTDEVEGARYAFNRDDEGRIVSVTFPYEGESYTARRVELPPPSLTGSAVFRLKGYAEANIVALAGSFNNWNQSQIICNHEGDEWVCRVDLNPGIYTYKFIVDGNWLLDPANSQTVEDEAGNINSMIEIEDS